MAGFVVAVTGGVASGKSAVTGLFEKHGIVVVDADAVARQVVGVGEPALKEIISRFGDEMLLADGSLDRIRMRALVFADLGARRDLEAITHPRIRTLLKANCRAATGPYALVAIPLLAETGALNAYAWLDRVLVVDTSVALQRSRLMSRDGIDSVLAARMIAAQASRKQRLALATDVLVNDVALHNMVEPVGRLHSMFAALASLNRPLP